MSTNTLQEKAIRSAGGIEELKRKNERYNVNVRFVEQQGDKLLEKFDEKWIAVYDGTVVASSSKLPNLMASIAKKGIPQGEVFVEYLTSKDILTLYIK